MNKPSQHQQRQCVWWYTPNAGQKDIHYANMSPAGVCLPWLAMCPTMQLCCIACWTGAWEQQ